MNRPPSLAPIALALVLILGLIGGLIHLMDLRIARGDSYPEYSTFRFDAFGTRALFDALSSITDLDVQRYTRPTQRLADPNLITAFYLGCARDLRIPDQWWEFVRSGGHLVVSVGNRDRQSRFEGQQAGLDTRSARTEAEIRYHQQSITHHHDKRAFNTFADDDLVTESLPRYNAGVFELLSANWTVLFHSNNDPTIVRRELGDGQLTFVSESFALSNEGLLGEPSTDFIRWLLADRHQVLFDETHHGIRTGGSITGLLRQYRLTPLYLSLIVVGLLVVWRASSTLRPKTGSEVLSNSSEPSPNGSMSGLLRRHLPSQALIPLCLKRWQHACQKPWNRLPQVEIERIVEESSNLSSDPIRAYQKIAQTLKRHRTRNL